MISEAAGITVIGDYHHPKTRLPGGGGAPEIAGSCGQVFITMTQSKRSMVEKIDFVTSFGHGDGGDARNELGLSTRGQIAHGSKGSR